MSAEQELARTKSGLILSSHRVYQSARAFMAAQEVSIPLTAIDSIRWGWIRSRSALYAAIAFFIFGGFLGDRLGENGAMVSVICSFVFLGVFWFWKRTVIEVYSSKSVLIGSTASEQEAKDFAGLVNMQVNVRQSP